MKPHPLLPPALRRLLPARLVPAPRLAPSSRLPLLLLLVATLLLALNFLFSSVSTPLTPSLRTLPEEPGAPGGGPRPRRRPLPCLHSPRPPLYVFLHLHKTAGNTLKVSLFSFAKRNALALHHTCHPPLPDAPLSAWWFNRRKALGPRAPLDCNLDALAALPPARRDRVDLVMGHQFVGAHALFPSRDVRYFTFVRRPLDRKVSHFLHFERDTVGTDLGAALARYLVERNRNYMTKRLATDVSAGELATDLRARFVDLDSFATRAALRAAKRNLVERFFFVGLQERYAESVCVLARILNAACGREGTRLARDFPLRPGRVAATKENERGETMRRVRQLPLAVRNAALRAEGADVELYKFAERLFEDKLQSYPECRTVNAPAETQT